MSNSINYFLIIIMTACGGFAGLFLKKTSSFQNIRKLILDYNLYIGGFLYLFGAVINIYVLKSLDYSIVLPLTSITYLWTMIISYFKLGEKITNKKIIGVFCIFIGAIFIAIN
ncbi:EamA family transporter [Clostridium sp. ZBS17]|uniref:EamA family transporter n=1 Tax=Clostridium sp. ZBS17 TaxID=2949968 RepID=UPI0020793B8A|nr:EamA family transporter [Clostridium sp. ZBS17]